MATTSIWPVKGWLANLVIYVKNPAKTVSPKTVRSSDAASIGTQALDDVINYTMDNKKTEVAETIETIRCFVTGINCTTTAARDQMMATKQRYCKDGGIIAYHGYQSFAPGETTPEQAHSIGIELATKLWGDRFEVIVATHLDKGHLHNHLLVNSVSFADGLKFRSNKTTYGQLRAASDKLCKDNNLSVIERPHQGKAKNYGEWRAERVGKQTWKDIIREDLEQALCGCISNKGLMQNLKRMGYEVKWGQEISLKPPGKERFMRPARHFGEVYSNEGLRHRFNEEFACKHPHREVFVPKPKPRVMHQIVHNCKTGSIFWLFYHYCYLLRLHEAAPKSSYYSPQLRKDIQKLEKYDRQVRMLWRHKIDTLPRLEELTYALETRVDELVHERKCLYDKAARMPDTDDRKQIRDQIDEINAKLQPLRLHLRDCKEVRERSLSGVMVTKDIAKVIQRGGQEGRRDSCSRNS